MRARAPASTSNLGPGFDVLGLALALYVEVTVAPADALVVAASGEGRHYPADATHLAARVVSSVLGHERFSVMVRSEIPPGRGLGSSAALAVAAAAAAGARDPLAVAAGFDGHGENAAASLLGGLVAATFVDGAVVTRRLLLDPGIEFVVLVPDRSLETKTARALLPDSVPFADAVFNLGRLGLLVAGLADRAALVGAAGDDRLHQDRRSSLYPEAPELLRRLRDAGAALSCWSGAGPSLVGICTSAAAALAVREAGEEALAAVGLSGTALSLRPDLEGLVVTES